MRTNRIFFDRGNPDRREDALRKPARTPQEAEEREKKRKQKEKADWRAERVENLFPVLREALAKGFAPQIPEERWGSRAERAFRLARLVAYWFHEGRVGDCPGLPK